MYKNGFQRKVVLSNGLLIPTLKLIQYLLAAVAGALFGLAAMLFHMMTE